MNMPSESGSVSNTFVNPNALLIIPQWITKEYFHPIIEKDVKDFAAIKNFTPIAATQPGENYTSIMVRVIADIELKDGSEQQVSYILKTTLDADKGGDLITSLGFFPKEKQMYQTLIPTFTKLYKEAGVDIELAPKCVHVEENANGIILVLEDLKKQNFHNIDRLKGLDMVHMRKALHKLAELHAVSAVNHDLNGPYDEMFMHSLYNESHRNVFEGITKVRSEQQVKAMRQWQLPDVDKYINMIPSPTKYFDNAIELNKINENEFNCLNHGDLWCNNIMFSEEGRTLFVDLQIGKWGSPAQDLWYLITTSASLDIKIKQFDHFIRIYHERLVECLKLLKYSRSIPTLKELHLMMIKYGNWGPMTATSTFILIALPSEKDSNLHLMTQPGPEGDSFRYKAFSNPYYVQAMLQLYPFFENKGLLQDN